MKFDTAKPFFHPKDITAALKKFKDILEGKGMLSMGENVSTFEKCFADYLGVKYAAATNSCTSALEIAMKALNIRNNDEIIVPVQTFFATGSSVVNAGAKIKFCDIDSNFLLDFSALKNKISNKTKAVIIVHFAGLIHPQILEIKKYLKEKGIFLIEDAAHAHGAKIGNLFSGTIGDIGCFSFYSTKIMTTGEGGMITTNNRKLYNICSSLRNRGIDTFSKNEIFSNFGSNNRMTEFQAILGLCQLKRLPSFVKHRNKIADIYKKELSGLMNRDIISYQIFAENILHAYWRFIIFLKDPKISRKNLKNKLKKYGIKIDWPYAPLLHLQPSFKKAFNTGVLRFPNAEYFTKRHFCLPLHLGIKEKDAAFIAKTVNKLIK